jgi:hypothetical protein
MSSGAAKMILIGMQTGRGIPLAGKGLSPGDLRRERPVCSDIQFRHIAGRHEDHPFGDVRNPIADAFEVVRAP